MREFTKGEMLVITGLTAMVEEEGLTPHEALGKAEQLGKDIYFALMDIKNGKA